MDALAISAANLDTIEKNLGAVADELTGVISNVTDVNEKVSTVENKVANLNTEVKNLVKEIRETTIITNARQSIMYNTNQIEKKYGYFDQVRRTTESLLDAVENSSIRINSLIKLKQELILNNPNYWLANALAALTSWILDDKEDTEKELHNALKKDEEKTSLFFCLVNLKLGRTSPATNWLNKYLSSQNATALDKDFITVLDLVSTGVLGNEGKQIVLNKLAEWFNRLNNEKQIQDKQIDIWKDFIDSHEEKTITLPYLETASKDANIIKRNLSITSSYKNVLNHLEDITYNGTSNKNIDEILDNLIYEYETKEQQYQKDNMKNQLIIECNGNTEEAEQLFKKQEDIYSSKEDLISLLSHIIIYKNNYKISNETQKLAIALVSSYILKAYDEIEKELNKNAISLKINNFETTTKTGTEKENINRELDAFVDKEFQEDDKGLIIVLIILNVLGIVGIFITLKNRLLSGILIAMVLIGNLLLLIRLHRKTMNRIIAKRSLKETINEKLETVLAEVVDINKMTKEDLNEKQKLLVFLNNIKPEDYINSNKERNIKIGEDV